MSQYKRIRNFKHVVLCSLLKSVQVATKWVFKFLDPDFIITMINLPSRIESLRACTVYIT